jgi:hypothetical protein
MSLRSEAQMDTMGCKQLGPLYRWLSLVLVARFGKLSRYQLSFASCPPEAALEVPS